MLFIFDYLVPYRVKIRLLYPWNFAGKNTGVGYHSFLWGNLPNPGIEPRPPVLQADSLPSKPQGKSIFRGGRKKGREERNYYYYYRRDQLRAGFACFI